MRRVLFDMRTGTTVPMTNLKAAPPRRLLHNLPVFSPIAVKLMMLVADEDVSFKEVAKLFSLDPVLAGQILRLANSGLYGRGVAVQSVLQALAMLGLKSISRIAVTAALTSGFARPISPWLRDWWRHSIASALIADHAGSGTLDLDFGYTAGLLHAIGRLALFRSAPQEYPKLLDPACTSHAEALACERERFGVDRAELARLILAEWGLPASLQLAVSRYHVPHPPEPLTAAVRAGCYYAEWLGFGQCGGCLGASVETTPARPEQALDPFLLSNLAIEVNRIEIDCALA
jgi:HD-like signal output (HDOD) protein